MVKLVRHLLLLVVALSCSLAWYVSAASPYQDPALEAKLDQYLNLSTTDPTAASEQLTALIQNIDEQTPIESLIRALSYHLIELQQRNARTEIDTVLAQIKAMDLTLSVDAQAEALAAELEILMVRNQLNEAYIKADVLADLLADSRNPRVRYWVYGLLGNLYRLDSQYEKSLTNYERAIDALAELPGERSILRRASLNLQIARVQSDLKNYSRAQDMLEQLIDEAKRFNQVGYLPSLYLSLGFVLAEQQKFAEAEQANLAGLSLAKEQQLQGLKLTFKNNLGSIYLDQADYNKAEQILKLALEETIPLEEPDTEYIIRFNLGFIAAMRGAVDSGLQQMQQAFEHYQQRGNKVEIEGFLPWFARVYRYSKDFEQLANTLEYQLELREAILSESREKSINDLQARYDMKSQNQRITILQQQNDLQEELLKNKQLQQKLTLLFVLVMFFAAILLIQLYLKVRRSNRRLKEMNKALEYQSLRDPLTGLFNRRAMQERMTKRLQSPQTSPCSLLLLDIDFFKQINDHYGHAAGDAVLIEISQRLSALSSKEDLVIRWGGEEFLIVMPIKPQAEIDAFCQQLMQVVSAEAVNYEGESIAVTISGGFINLPFANIPEQQFNWERVLQIADMALYLSKVNGRNQINLITDLTVSFEEVEPHLQSDLSGAIRANMVQYHTLNG